MNATLQGRLICCLLTLFAANEMQAQIKGNPQLKKNPSPASIPKSSSPLSRDLQSLYQSRTISPQARRVKPVFQDNALNKFMIISGDRVLVDVTTSGDEQKAKAELQKLGLVITGTYGKMISGSVPISALPLMGSSSSLKFARPAYKPLKLSGPAFKQTAAAFTASKSVPVISQGDTAQRSYIARKKYRVDGKGVKVGVMSDSYNTLGGAQKGVLHGELPGPGNPFKYKKPVQVLADDTTGNDEGRAMAEIVHDVAPGAEIAFNTATGGQAVFAQSITRLADAGCKVIADDVIYFAEPFFQDGVVAQAIDKVKRKGVTYFSAAGNTSVRSYESDYRPSNAAPLGPEAGTAHNFSAPGNTPRYFQPIFIPSHSVFIASFQWDNPFYSASNGQDSATTDLDIYLLNDTGAVVAGGATDNLASGDPIELFGYQNDDTVNQTFYLAILKYAGPDISRLKYVLYGDGAFYLTAPSIPGILAPALVGHAKADGAIATGAAFYLQTPAYGTDTAVIESYSGVGGVANYFTAGGERIAPMVRKKPEIVAPDGVNTSFFDPFGNGDIQEDSDTYPNFFGTSAAAPHAAGVAALMIQAQRLKTLTPSQIKGIMSANTSDMDDPDTQGFDKGFDFETGYGLIKADKAVGAVKFPNLYIKDLKPEAVCSDDPAQNRRWKVQNPNPFDLNAHWFLVGFNQSGDIAIPANGSYSFTTKTEYYYNRKVPNVLILDWEDNFGFSRFRVLKSIGSKCGESTTVASASELEEDPSVLSKPVVAEVYPNPSASEFRLYLSLPGSSNVNVQLMGIDGRKLMSKTVQSEGVFSFDAAKYASGVYFMQVRQGTFTKTIKLVKQ